MGAFSVIMNLVSFMFAGGDGRASVEVERL